MALLQALKSLVTERLSAAAEEIFCTVGSILREYEEEALHLKEEIQHRHRLMDQIFKPYIKLNRTEIPLLPVCREEVSPEERSSTKKDSLRSTKRNNILLKPCNSMKRKISIGLLRNGNHKRRVKVGKTHVGVTNTCAFDSFCQCLSCAFCDSPTFCNYVNREAHGNEMFNLVQTIATKGVEQDAYTQRAKMLCNMFDAEQIKYGAQRVSAECHVYTIISETMKQAPSVTTHKRCSSPRCTLSAGQSSEHPIVVANSLTTDGVKNLQAAIERGLLLKASTCLRPLRTAEDCPELLKQKETSTQMPVCMGSVTHSYTTGNLLCIETAGETSYRLCDFPVRLRLQQSFTLRGIVAFLPGQRGALGHYVAFCRRPSSDWERYDDLSTCITTVPDKTKMQPHVALYTKDN